jgi:hypothetical protein
MDVMVTAQRTGRSRLTRAPLDGIQLRLPTIALGSTRDAADKQF